MLDLDVREKTNGAKDLKQVIAELSKKYGASRPFDDNKLFDELVAVSDPRVRTFIDNYIVGSMPFPGSMLYSLSISALKNSSA